VGGVVSGLCPVAGFGISGVQTLDSATAVLIGLVTEGEKNKEN
jgi:hypothetical protein